MGLRTPYHTMTPCTEHHKDHLVAPRGEAYPKNTKIHADSPTEPTPMRSLKPIKLMTLLVLTAALGCADTQRAPSAQTPSTAIDGAPQAGNPKGGCDRPEEAKLEDISSPTTVVGDGSPSSCTSEAFVAAVAKGGVITFDCGPDPVTIKLKETAKIFNNTGPKIVIDGQDKITLSGEGKRRILYQNTCDQAQAWTTPMCQDQDHPQLSIQRLTFIDGDASAETAEGGGGGAIFVRGGRLKVIGSRFFNNRCAKEGPDVGGGAIRVLSQRQGKPVYVVDSTFGGDEQLGNACSNGGALSSIGVSFTVINSVFSHNEAIGYGANPAKPNTPGGGGGAIYNDGNTFSLRLCGVDIHDNSAREGGGAIFFVSNDRSGTLHIESSTLKDNPSEGFESDGLPGIFVLAKEPPRIISSTLE